MAENSESAAAELMSNIMETIAEKLPKQKSVQFDDGDGSEGSSISDQAKKLFGGGGGENRKKSVHHVLGGGKPADVLLWRNKKISSSVLGVATLVWVFFEWLDYHFLTIICFLLALGMAVQFAWATFGAVLNRGSPSSVPRVQLPEELFANAGAAVGAQVNRALGFLQDVACGRDLKQLLIVIAGFFAAAVVGSFCNFLTVIYIGFVCAHTVPVLYERYQDQVDDFLCAACWGRCRASTRSWTPRASSRAASSSGRATNKLVPFHPFQVSLLDSSIIQHAEQGRRASPASKMLPASWLCVISNLIVQLSFHPCSQLKPQLIETVTGCPETRSIQSTVVLYNHKLLLLLHTYLCNYVMF